MRGQSFVLSILYLPRKCTKFKQTLLSGQFWIDRPQANNDNSKLTLWISFSRKLKTFQESILDQTEKNQATSFNRIQDGAWLKSSCVQNLKFPNVPYVGSFQLSAMF